MLDRDERATRQPPAGGDGRVANLIDDDANGFS
jgi:hypothetical protein